MRQVCIRDQSERCQDFANRQIASLGMIPTENGTAHYVQFMREDYDRYAAVVKALGLKAE